MAAIKTVEAGFSWCETFLEIDRGDYEAGRYRLARMRTLLGDFGDPHRAYETVHVAGSKGKGSTAAFIASVLAAAGSRCGLYSSPHVESPRERVRVLDGSLTDELAVGVFNGIRAYVERIARTTRPALLPTYFELVTLFGFLVFREARCEIAVVEVGIGGRTDATNLVRPIASVITPVELEHTERLGRTLRSIAAEKAGIVKRGVPVVVGRQHPEALATIRRVAELRRAPVHDVVAQIETFAAETSTSGTLLRLRLRGGLDLTSGLRLIGTVQAQNAALAALTATVVRPHLGAEVIAAGLAGAWIPGRSELVPGPPAFLLDGAHTERSVRSLCDTAAELCRDRRARVAIYGSVSGKDHESMLAHLIACFDRIVITRPGSFKPSDLALLHRTCAALGGVATIHERTEDALAAARASVSDREDALIVVTGSFYLVGAVRCLLRDEIAAGRDHETRSGVQTAHARRTTHDGRRARDVP